MELVRLNDGRVVSLATEQHVYEVINEYLGYEDEELTSNLREIEGMAENLLDLVENSKRLDRRKMADIIYDILKVSRNW